MQHTDTIAAPPGDASQGGLAVVIGGSGGIGAALVAQLQREGGYSQVLALSRRYGRGGRLGEEEVLLCLYSISDNNSYLLFNRDPIDRRAGRAGAGRGTTHTHPPLACCAG